MSVSIKRWDTPVISGDVPCFAPPYDIHRRRLNVVEVGGVEPPSESTLTGLSPGADGYCGSLPPCSPSGRQAVTPAGWVSFMMCGTGKAYRTHIYR